MNFIQLKEEKGAGFGFLLMICIYVLTAFVVQAVLGAFGLNSNSAKYMAINGCVSAFACGTVILLYLKSSKTPVKEFLKSEKVTFDYIVYAILLTAGMFFGLGFANQVFVEVLKQFGLHPHGIQLPLNSPLKLIVFIVVFAILPAVFEELFFRKYLLDQTKTATSLAGIFVISLFFAFYHMSLSQLIYQLSYGIALALLTKRAKSIYPAMLSHFLNNFAVLMLTYFSIEVKLTNPFVIISGLLCLVIFFMGIYQKQERKSDDTAKLLLMPYGAIALLICLALAVGGAL